MSNQLFSCYLSQELIGKSFLPDQIFSISIYGKPQKFKLSLPLSNQFEDLKLDETKPYLISKK